MSQTLAAGTTTITLPDDLFWVDEYAWLPTMQQAEVAFDGSLIVEEWSQQAGRPVTLAGAVNYAWIDRGTLESLRVLAATARNSAMTLTLTDGRALGVLFRHGSPPAVDAAPIVPYTAAVPGDVYSLTLRFLQVS